MTDAQRQLHQALKVHKFDLEIERGAASDCDLEDRIEATGRVLKWLEQATLREARGKACMLHRDVNLLLGNDPAVRARTAGRIAGRLTEASLQGGASICGQGPSRARRLGQPCCQSALTSAEGRAVGW